MIKKIKWDNYISLGNLELDFTKPDGSVYNTIILAGNNGTGKTRILDSLSIFLNLGSISPFESIEYEVNEETYIITQMQELSNTSFHYRKKVSDGTPKPIRTDRYNNPNSLNNDTEDIRYYGFSYSRAKTGFKTNPINSSQTESIDSDKYDDDSNEDYTRIKQLLVDISGQDNSDWMKLCRSGAGNSKESFEVFKKSSRLHRFTEAFDGFFSNMKFSEIDEGSGNNNEKKIIFSKYGKNIDVDDLSTGEKQIVFRGAHLLKNCRNIDGGIVLIDEPELSMHPSWQKKILKYYQTLFDNNGQQSVQMIIATHSSYVIESALKDKENVLVVVLNEKNGNVIAERIVAPSVLPVITAAETNYLAFHIPTIDYHIELYGYLQNKNNLGSIKSCDDYIARQSQYISSRHGWSSSYGNTQYQTLPTYIRNAIDHPDPNHTFTDEQLMISIELLIELCR